MIVVEHDEGTIRAADHVVDLGPGAGEHGGELVAEGTPEEVERRRRIADRPVPLRRARDPGARRAPRAARRARGPRRRASTTSRASTSRSRSASSPASPASRARASRRWSTRSSTARSPTASTARGCAPAPTTGSTGIEQVDKIINIDQSPIGRTPRSNPATYTGVFDHIRQLYSRTREARARGYKPGRFSLQRQGRALRGLPRRRADQDRDALPARRLRPLRAVPRPPLQPRDARGPLQGQVDRRRARDVGRRGGRVLRRRSRRSPGACRRCTTSGSTTSGSASRRRRSPAARRSGSSSPPSSRRWRPATPSTSSTSRPPACTSPTSSACSRCSAASSTPGNTVVVIEHNLDVIKSADHLDRPRARGRRGGRRGPRHRHPRAGRRGPDLLHGQLPARPGRARGAGAEAAAGEEGQAPGAGPRLSRPDLATPTENVWQGARAMSELAAWRTWWIKRRWYERNRRLRRRWRINRHMARAGAFIRYPVEGEVLEALDSGRLAIGESTLLEPGCWLTLGPEARITIGARCFLNRGTMLAASKSIEIGDHVMFANGCFVGDADHRYDDPEHAGHLAGLRAARPGADRLQRLVRRQLRGHRRGRDRRPRGDRRQLGGHQGHPPGEIAAGAPAKVMREIEFKHGRSMIRNGTYSIVARDPASGELGVAVQSHWFSVGSIVTWARPGVGAVATQSIAEPAYGPRLLDRLAAGEAPREALAQELASDELARFRQVAVVDSGGRVAVHTRRRLHAARRPPRGRRLQRPGEPDGLGGGLAGDGWAFESAEGPLARRLLAALDAAEAAGRRRARAPVGGPARGPGRRRAVADERRAAGRRPRRPAGRAAPPARPPATPTRSPTAPTRSPARATTTGPRGSTEAPPTPRPRTSSWLLGRARDRGRRRPRGGRGAGPRSRSMPTMAGASCSPASTPRSRPRPRRFARRSGSRRRPPASRSPGGRPCARAGGRRSRSGPAAARCRAPAGRRSPGRPRRRRRARRAGGRASWSRG